MSELLSPSVGDRMFVESRIRLDPVVVTKVTKAHIIINDTKYRRDGGRQVGGGAWDYNYLREATPEVEARYAAQRAEAHAYSLISQIEARLRELRRSGHARTFTDALSDCLLRLRNP